MYPNYRGNRRDREGSSWQNDMVPPNKRPRNYDRGPSNYQNNRYQNNNNINYNNNLNYGPYHGHHNHGQPDHLRDPKAEPSKEEGEYPKQMKTFKQFINDLDDNITEEEAANDYRDYKIEFKRTHVRQFYDKFKECEWFMEKYRPAELQQRLREQRESRRRRLDVFMELINHEWFKDIKLDYNEENNIKVELFLDACIIKLEGGTNNDIQTLMQRVYVPEQLKALTEGAANLARDQSSKHFELQSKNSTNADPNKLIEENNAGENDAVVTIKEEDEGIDCDDKPSSYKENSTSEQLTVKVEDDADQEHDEKMPVIAEKKADEIHDNPANMDVQEADNTTRNSETFLHKTSSIYVRNLNSAVTKKDLEQLVLDCTKSMNEKKENQISAEDSTGIFQYLRMAMSDPVPPSYVRRAWITFKFMGGRIKDLTWKFSTVDRRSYPWLEGSNFFVNKDISHRIKPLTGAYRHKLVVKADIKNAVSIITHLDKLRGIWESPVIEEEPQNLPSKNDSSTEELKTEKNIQEIKIKQEEDTAVANIMESVSENVYQQSIDESLAKNQSDESLAKDQSDESLAKDQTDESLVKDQSIESLAKDQSDQSSLPTKQTNDEFDPVQKNNMICEPMSLEEDGDHTKNKHGPKNPLLEGIEQYLIEESNIEENELIGATNLHDEEEVEQSVELSRDENLERVLDRLLLYLRIVHSIDYYNACEYSFEDNMPTRIGYIHTRGAYDMKSDLQSTIREFKSKLKHLTEESVVSEEEQKQLGKYDMDELVEKFISENTIKVSPEKYLCPVSKKRFMSAEFVRKHILSGKNELVVAALKDLKLHAECFNNYIADPKRLTEIKISNA